MAPQGMAANYKPTEEKKYNSTNLALNQSRNVEKRKVNQLRLGNNATDMVFAQKKLSIKVDREQANKTGGARGIQLNQNDIVFSKTMNLSQFLSAQTKQVTSGSQSATNQQSNGGSIAAASSAIPKTRVSHD